MAEPYRIIGNKNVVIQDVKSSSITIRLNGEPSEIEFNTVLTVRLLTALSFLPIQKNLAKGLLEDLENEEGAGWERKREYIQQAKKEILQSFKGNILGVRLRKLFAMGREMDKSTKKDYIDQCHLTSQTFLRLFCFLFVSQLWDYKKEHRAPPLDDVQAKMLQDFFDGKLEKSAKKYVNLACMFFDLFKPPIALPISEVEHLRGDFQIGTELYSACEKLDNINSIMNNAEYDATSLLEVEECLTVVIEKMAFFSLYKMVFMRRIECEKDRSVQTRYLHSFSNLNRMEQGGGYSDDLIYLNEPTCSNAALFYKDNYQSAINLFPFVLDLNSLYLENGTQVCFFLHNQRSQKGLLYHKMEDDGEFELNFNDILKSEDERNALMMDVAKRKLLKSDFVFDQFLRAKHVILDIVPFGEEANNSES